MKAQRVRPPAGFKLADPAGHDAALAWSADWDTLQQIVSGLDQLEQVVDASPVFTSAAERGYFTPDEDDRVRQGVLAYRNYRLAAYEIIFRHQHYDQLPEAEWRLRSFLLAFAAALVLYSKSLKIIQVVEPRPMLRAKINEPDAKFELEAGFFDDVVMGYSSLSNYRSIAVADRYWRAHRRSSLLRELSAEPSVNGLCDIIRHRRSRVRKRYLDVLRRRLGSDWRAFWRSVMRPARDTRYGLQTLIGGRFAGLHLVSKPRHVLTPDVLGALRPQLQPGDVLLCRAEGKLTAELLPGFWSHAAIYLGSREELLPLEVSSQPLAARHWAEMPEVPAPLGCVIEGVAPRVRIAPLELSMEADHLLVLRPRISPNQMTLALGEAFGHLGKPYDFEFDFNSTSRVVCTELVYRSYQGTGAIQFPLVKRLGRFTLSGDDIAHFALDEWERAGGTGQALLQPAAMILKRRDGQAHPVPVHRIVPLLRRIRAGWRPARKAPVPRLPAAPA